MSKDTGGPAFPCDNVYTGNGEFHNSQGMTLRDYFAAKALPSVIDTFAFGNANPTDYAQGIAEGCYEIADAMLRARGEA